MKPVRTLRKTLAGIAGFGAVLAIAGAWVPAKNAPTPDDCGCTVDGGQQGLSGGVLPGSESEWCLTQRVFIANLQVGKGGGPLGPDACTVYGPPDDPVVRDAAIPSASTPIKTVRLMIHVFREKFGLNPAASASDVANAIDRLNASYAVHRVQFTANWRFIDSTAYRYLDDNEVGMMKFKYAQSPATQLNIYVTKYNPGGSWGTFPWDANSLGTYGGIVLDQPHFIDPAVPSHEVGHCLGLWHTFHGVSEVAQCSDCYEPAGRSAQVGDLTGDKCSDTNPLPRTFVCADPAGIDPCSGNSWLDTPMHNYMGYSLSCATEFTVQQGGRMHAWTANSLTGWLALPPPPAVPGTPTLSTSGGTVTIAWEDNSNDETGFDVRREKKGSGNKWTGTTIVATVGANVTSTTNAPGTGTFRYSVRSFNDSGPSAWSAWAQINN